MKLFDNLDISDVERVEDRLGGYQSLDSDIYDVTIKAAYTGKSKGGALYVTLLCSVGGQDYTETIYITDKKQSPYIVSGNKKRLNTGCNIVNNICLVATGKSLNDLEVEDKVLSIYDYNERKNVNSNVPVIVDLSNTSVSLAIVKELHNKVRAKSDGTYEEIPESKEVNKTVAVFYPSTHKTVNEQQDNKDAQFWDKWLEKNQGKVFDKRKLKEVNSSSVNTPFTSTPASTHKSLFS